MSSATSSLRLTRLSDQVTGPVLEPGSTGYAEETATFNLAIAHRPDFVVGVTSVDDIQAAVTFARDQGLTVGVLGGGHSTEGIVSGVLLSTRRLDAVTVDAGAQTATFGAGVRWEAVIDTAAEYGLHPVTGSSPRVGAVGYLLGGGLGPLARSHGVSSDYLEAATLVTGRGDIVHVSARSHPELLWALRGGKKGLGVVSEMTVRLVPLTTIYAGSLTFGEEQVESALRGWFAWTRHADERISTSAAMIRFPDLPMLPPHLRGRHQLTLRVAWPGPMDAGAAMVAPLRALGPMESDLVGPLSMRDIARIHNDPAEPGRAWIRGALLREGDDDAMATVLQAAGPGQASPFNLVEIRHLGAAVRRDVDGGSAFNGRDAAYAIGLGALDPGTFATSVPDAWRRFRASMEPWLMPGNTINFLGNAYTEEDLAQSWSPETLARLKAIRASVDPDGVFNPASTVTLPI